MKEVLYNNKVVARLISEQSWTEGLGFYSKQSQYLQVGSWNYNKGKILLSHVHNVVERNIDRTNEVLFIRKGSIKAEIFALNGEKLEELILKAGDILILLQCGHGYQILEDNTEVLEIKNGPYFGAQVDRRRFEF